tara:strand:+ start:86 stop:310 length:225 start_codon:yes stop_codon:yes gene_type:complete
MDKISDAFLWMSGIVVAGVSWVVTRLFKSVDLAHRRIDRIESQVVDRPFLESQLAPIRADLNMIMKHLLSENKK